MVATTPNQITPRPWYARLGLVAFVPQLLLAMIMVWSVARSIETANWADGLDMLAGLSLLALLFGALFARIAWLPSWLAHPLSAMLGVAFAVQQISPLVGKQVAAEFGAAKAQRLASWGDYAAEIVLRAIVWARTIQAGGRGEDIVLFIVTLALVAWLLGYSTAWLLFRRYASWLAVVLSVGLILINYTYTWPKPTALFFVFLTAAVMLIAYQHVIGRQDLWRHSRVEFPDFLPARFLVAASVMFVALVGVTAILPNEPNNEQLARLWRLMRSPVVALREGWQDAFSTINAPPGSAGGFLTRNARVGGPRQLGTALVMTVRSSEYSYWRATAFDRYTGRMWQNTVGERARAALGVVTAEDARSPLDAGVRVDQAELRGRTLTTTTFELAQARTDGLIMVGGAFVESGLPVLIQHGYLEIGGEMLPNFTETATIVTDASLEASVTYTVSTYLSTVDEQSLRRSGVSYPEWVRGSYLQLPETVTPEVRALATEIVSAAGATTAYDKAIAIQEYLRTLPYNDQRPMPPDDRDWVDWFLFDARGGYCDDYASAMVVLLRAEGVPARWVQGYAGGDLDPDRRVYLVRESIAHSWPEVYFPGYGWQRFEPTPAPYASVPVRPALPPEDSTEDPGITSGLGGSLSDPEDIMRELMERNADSGGGDLEALQREIEARRAAERLRRMLIGGGIIGSLVALIGAFAFWLRWDVRGLSPAAVAYARLTRLAGWAGIAAPQDVTPYEYAALLKPHVPYQRHVIDRIVGDFVAERYRPGKGDYAGLSTEDWYALRRDLLLLLAGRVVAALRPARRQAKPRAAPRSS